jgi:hypothetical protein
VEKATSWFWDNRLSSKVASVKQEHNLREEGNPCLLGLGGCQFSSVSFRATGNMDWVALFVAFL